MDRTVFVTLLLTGSCVTSLSYPNLYYFVRQQMTWKAARIYCSTYFTELASVLNLANVTTMMNTPTGGYTGNAWIGLYQSTSRWHWLNDQKVGYTNWNTGQPDNINASEFCVSMNSDGYWNDDSCSELKPSVCFTGWSYYLIKEEMTWKGAVTNCKVFLTLANIPDEMTNYEIQYELSDVSEVWIGLSRPNEWLWSHTGRIYRYLNWQPGQPDNRNGKENCATVVVGDGTWTDEQCNTAFPFFCYGISKIPTTSKAMRVRMKIQSSANLEDPACNATLQQKV
ncbi:C-type mannose receptor 2-like [Micropterus salmoides]|uniref:C-type mannose receptor 2-like n=1 Tax=Micropterus salmoides TaxID=27706 RepID=UPI0018EBBFD2|nr:C-type mannose receptor 2-like [Micropterus salmoides]